MSSVVVRELEKADYDRGYLALLNQLTASPDVSREAFERTSLRRCRVVASCRAIA